MKMSPNDERAHRGGNEVRGPGFSQKTGFCVLRDLTPFFG